MSMLLLCGLSITCLPTIEPCAQVHIRIAGIEESLNYVWTIIDAKLLRLKRLLPTHESVLNPVPLGG